MLEYFNEQGSSNSEAAAFFDYYLANGWVQGKGRPIKDWKAAARQWIRRATEYSKTDKKAANPLDVYMNI